MAGRIKDEDIALVRERTPIADVIGEYLQLRNAGGGSLKGLCPFHDEKSPSFNVTPSKNLFYCFGCAEGGDAISFLQRIDNLSFTEAVESLAKQSGITLRYEEGGRSTRRGDEGQRQRLLEAHRAAAEFYAERLLSPEAVTARRFLTDRGFNRENAEQFGLGFAPAGWENLTTHLRHKGFTDQELITGGLASQGRRGAYDRFRNRLLWPVREVTGEVVGFGARKLAAEEDGPKYLNSPESPIFHKGRLLYGLDLAKREISRANEAVIVEGIGHDFAEVKALDLHHLGYDFVSDVDVGQRAGRAFLAAARTRRQLVLAAMDYLEGSGQSATIVELPVDDVAAMTRTARALSAGRAETGRFVLPSRIAGLRAEQEWAEAARRSKASSLDAELAVRVTARVDQVALEASAAPSDANQDRQHDIFRSSPTKD